MGKLPRSVQEIADVIGREQALRLIASLPRCYVGRNGGKSHQVILYVPKRLPADHQLVRILGWHDAKKLCEFFPGEILKPANCAEIIVQQHAERIHAMAKDGHDEQAIASVVNVSAWHIRRALKNPPDATTAAANDNRAPCMAI